MVQVTNQNTRATTVDILRSNEYLVAVLRLVRTKFQAHRTKTRFRTIQTKCASPNDTKRTPILSINRSMFKSNSQYFLHENIHIRVELPVRVAKKKWRLFLYGGLLRRLVSAPHRHSTRAPRQSDPPYAFCGAMFLRLLFSRRPPPWDRSIGIVCFSAPTK